MRGVAMPESVAVPGATLGIDATTRRPRRGHIVVVTVRAEPDNSSTARWWPIVEQAPDADRAVARRDDWPVVDVTYPDPGTAYVAALDALRTSAPR